MVWVSLFSDSLYGSSLAQQTGKEKRCGSSRKVGEEALSCTSDIYFMLGAVSRKMPGDLTEKRLKEAQK